MAQPESATIALEPGGQAATGAAAAREIADEPAGLPMQDIAGCEITASASDMTAMTRRRRHQRGDHR